MQRLVAGRHDSGLLDHQDDRAPARVRAMHDTFGNREGLAGLQTGELDVGNQMSGDLLDTIRKDTKLG